MSEVKLPQHLAAEVEEVLSAIDEITHSLAILSDVDAKFIPNHDLEKEESAH